MITCDQVFLNHKCIYTKLILLLTDYTSGPRTMPTHMFFTTVNIVGVHPDIALDAGLPSLPRSLPAFRHIAAQAHTPELSCWLERVTRENGMVCRRPTRIRRLQTRVSRPICTKSRQVKIREEMIGDWPKDVRGKSSVWTGVAAESDQVNLLARSSARSRMDSCTIPRNVSKEWHGKIPPPANTHPRSSTYLYMTWIISLRIQVENVHGVLLP